MRARIIINHIVDDRANNLPPNGSKPTMKANIMPTCCSAAGWLVLREAAFGLVWSGPLYFPNIE
jgi:hypothetical protein